jgi:hypothetical protein
MGLLNSVLSGGWFVILGYNLFGFCLSYERQGMVYWYAGWLRGGLVNMWLPGWIESHHVCYLECQSC